MAKNAKTESTPREPAQMSVDQSLVEALMGALIAERNKPPVEDATFEIVNTSGCRIAFPVTDTRTGIQRTITLEKRGSRAKATREQVLEAQVAFPHFFADGHVSCEALVGDNENVIHDIPAFLAAIEPSQVTETISKITSPSVLYELFHHIENLRFVHLDENKQPFKEKGVGGKDMLVVKEVDLDPKLIAVEIALQRRLLALNGVKLSLEA